ncbi:MAG: hypothetical protein HZA00_02335, partial [Nitrospinae bacterium]|nr:hypothetical protein [Nitrospinota bacterium]
LEVLEEEGLNNIKVKRIGIPDKFIEHGSQSIIRDKYQLTPSAIASTISEFLKNIQPQIDTNNSEEQRHYSATNLHKYSRIRRSF